MLIHLAYNICPSKAANEDIEEIKEDGGEGLSDPEPTETLSPNLQTEHREYQEQTQRRVSGSLHGFITEMPPVNQGVEPDRLSKHSGKTDRNSQNPSQKSSQHSKTCRRCQAKQECQRH